MGSLFSPPPAPVIMSPPPPPPLPPAAIPPTMANEGVQGAGQREAAKGRAAMSGTLTTGPQGLGGKPTLSQPSLLGAVGS